MEPASLYAPCVCGKDYVSETVSREISKSVGYRCGLGEDQASANDLFGEYCDMVKGTTSFARPASPSGDSLYTSATASHFITG